MNSLPISAKSNLPVNSLWTFNKHNEHNELKRLLIIVDLSQAFKRLVVEKDFSGVNDVAGLTINKLQSTNTFGIKLLLAFPISFIFLFTRSFYATLL